MFRSAPGFAPRNSIVVVACILLAILVSPAIARDGARQARNAKTPLTGSLTMQFSEAALEETGINVVLNGAVEADALASVCPLSPVSYWSKLDRKDSVDPSLFLSMEGGVLIAADGEVSTLTPFGLVERDGAWRFVGDPAQRDGWRELPIGVADVFVERDSLGDPISVSGSIVLDESWARRHDRGRWAGMTIGWFVSDISAASGRSGGAVAGGEDGVAGDVDCSDNVIGPDVIVGSVGTAWRWGRVNNTTAFSFRTEACSVGDCAVAWIAQGTDHPVIAQHVYRLKDGRFEQIGMSWVKHSFALTFEDECNPGGCQPNVQFPNHLVPGCSDAYSSSLNGSRIPTGPRFEVNPVTGDFLWQPTSWGTDPCDPPTAECTPEVNFLYKRVQLKDEDLDPDLNVGAQYFVEGHYIAGDDAEFGNQANNASHHLIQVEESSPNVFQILTPQVPSTVREQPAIMAWPQRDPLVQVSNIDVPDDGRFILASKAKPLPGGTWSYEYAVHNLYSDRAAGSFSVPLPAGVTSSNEGFHDIDHHSGDGVSLSGSYYDTTDWPVSIADESITWETTPFAEDERANAIHWGTLYNFRFEADACPTDGDITLGLFKPGMPESMTAAAPVPSAAHDPIAVVDSTPPHDAIDARQPSAPDGSSPAGWQQVDFQFNVCAEAMTKEAFAASEEGGAAPDPAVALVSQLGGGAVGVELSARIDVGAWTTVTNLPAVQDVRIGSLPGDVNADRHVTPHDILALMDHANGAIDPLPEWSTDIDRSTATDADDVARLLDLFDGVDAFAEWLGASLP